MDKLQELNNNIKNLQTDFQNQVEKFSQCSASDNCYLHYCKILAEKYSKAVKLCEKYFEESNLESFIKSVIDLGLPINDLKLKKYNSDPRLEDNIIMVGVNQINIHLDAFEECLEEIYLWKS